MATNGIRAMDNKSNYWFETGWQAGRLACMHHHQADGVKPVTAPAL